MKRLSSRISVFSVASNRQKSSVYVSVGTSSCLCVQRTRTCQTGHFGSRRETRLHLPSASNAPANHAISRSRIGPVRQLAVKVNVGHGPAHFESQSARRWDYDALHDRGTTAAAAVGIYRRGNNAGERIRIRATPEQQKAARLELDRMTKSTQSILDGTRIVGDKVETTMSSASSINELRVLLNYWTSRWYSHHHPLLTATSTVSMADETGAQYAEKLFDLITDANTAHGSSDLIDKVIALDGNAAVTNLVDAYLMPCLAVGSSGNDEVDRSEGSFVSPKLINVTAWSNAIMNSLRILKKMHQLFRDDTSSLKPDTLSVNTSLNVLSKLCSVLSDEKIDEDTKLRLGESVTDAFGFSPTPAKFSNLNIANTLTLMENILSDSERMFYEDGNSSIKPSVYTYNTVIGTIARHDSNKNGLERLDKYLHRMKMAEDDTASNDSSSNSGINQEQYPATCPPDVVTYNSILYLHLALAASGKKRAALHTQQSKAVLREMENRYARTQRPEVQPDTITYATVLHTFANAGDAYEAERILSHMQKLSQSDRWAEKVQTNVICFNSTLHALSKCGEEDAAPRAEALLQHMESLGETKPELGISPDTISYCAVIAAWARSNADDSIERAEELLQRTLEAHRAGNNRVKADIVTYNTILHAFAKQCWKNRGEEALAVAERAEMMVEEMERSEDVVPCTITYNTLIECWAKAGCKGSEEKAEAVLRRMPKPDVISWNSALAAHANLGTDRGLLSAFRLLQEMEQSQSILPTATTYNLVLDSLTRGNSIESAEKCETILHKMEEQYEAGNVNARPSAITYNIVINAWARSGSKSSGKKAQALLERMSTQAEKWDSSELSPDAFSYSSVIGSLTNSGSKIAVDEAESILQTMQDSGVASNTVTYNSVLNCIAKSGVQGSSERAEAILAQMEQLRLTDEITYSTVLNILARSGDDNAAERAEAILHRLEEGAEDGSSDIRLTVHAYSSVLNALARSKDPTSPDRALDLLNRMQSMYKSGVLNFQPNQFCFNSVINAYAKSRHENKASISEKILLRMLDEFQSGRNRDAKPSNMTYSTILNACAYTTGSIETRQEAFRIARSCLKAVLSMDSSNCVAFSMFLLACARLAPRGPERDVLVESVFNEACRRGQVDELVIRNLRNAASPRLLSKLLGRAGSGDLNDLPREWKCNVDRRYHTTGSRRSSTNSKRRGQKS